MPTKPPDQENSRESPNDAAKKPDAARKARAAAREARLAEALRKNLRRRKAGGQTDDEVKDE